MISWFPNNKNPERWALTQHRYSTTVILGDKYNKICETDNLNKDREKKIHNIHPNNKCDWSDKVHLPYLCCVDRHEILDTALENPLVI